MTDYHYLARSFNSDSLSGVGSLSGYGSLVGTDPLDTFDGDASYVEPVHPQGVTWRLSAAGAEAPAATTWTRMRVQVWWRQTAGPEFAALRLKNDAGPTTTVYSLIDDATDAGGGWHVSDFDVSLGGYASGALTLAGAWFVFSARNSSGSATARATRFLLTITAGEAPLRQRNRGTIRQRNQASRQASLRQRGFL